MKTNEIDFEKADKAKLAVNMILKLIGGETEGAIIGDTLHHWFYDCENVDLVIKDLKQRLASRNLIDDRIEEILSSANDIRNSLPRF